MKVVLFCGGMGMRLRDYSDQIPKPLVDVGHRPILWHLMKYYSHFGHKEFILCLGHGAYKIKDFFLHYDEWATNDFILSGGGRDVELLGTDIQDWRITFAKTGLTTSIGERLRRVRHYLGDDEAGGRVASAYGENYNRLAAIKKKYDPKNVFRINQNIKPAA